MKADKTGIAGKIADCLNDVISLNQRGVSRAKWARQGKLGGQTDVKDVAGVWKDLTDSVNYMAGNLKVVQYSDVALLQKPARKEGRKHGPAR